MRLPGVVSFLVLAVATPAAAQGGFPQVHPWTSAEKTVDFALTAGCLPFLLEGGSIHERIDRSSRRVKVNGRPADALHGRGRVTLQEDGRGCYLTAKVDPEALRRGVIDALAANGSSPVARFDSGAGGRDSVGSFRQEAWCFTLGGRPAALVMSTSRDRRRPALQASLFLDRDGSCAPAAAP